MATDIIKKILAFFLDSIQTLLLAASVFLVIYVFLFRPYQVNGESMFPNFQNGEYVLTNLTPKTFNLKGPFLGDVIVFKAPPDPEKDYIKRVIGLPGDHIMVKEGNVFLNGHKLDETKYLSSEVKTYPQNFAHEGQEIVVPLGNFFVLGDNRLNSSDSRDWGFVPKDNIIGESMFVYWPPQNARTVKNPYKSSSK